MDNPENWLWIWLAAGVALGIGEMLAAGSFFLAPFAAGAFAAFAASWLGASVFIQWALFLVVSGGSFLALRPLARRLDASYPSEGIGATHMIGAVVPVVEAIPETGVGVGMVRIDRQEWRAESLDGNPIDAGVKVRVVEVRGTRVIVIPVDLTAGRGEEPVGPDPFDPDPPSDN